MLQFVSMEIYYTVSNYILRETSILCYPDTDLSIIRYVALEYAQNVCILIFVYSPIYFHIFVSY